MILSMIIIIEEGKGPTKPSFGTGIVYNSYIHLFMCIYIYYLLNNNNVI